ncbi:MAG: F0F1 ATP synthase subunit B [Burkholderiales bacterium]|nr:F0F1 ATP synthase subunit B [Burkholderiales bacterium]
MNINATLLGQMLTFAVLVWFTMKFVWPPIMKALDERQRKIADGLAAAERARQDLASAEARAAEIEREARAKAQELLAAADKRAAAIVDEAKAAAKGEADRIVAGAKAEIDQEAQRAKDQLRSQVAALAVAGAQKILAREIDAKAHAEMLARLEKELA